MAAEKVTDYRGRVKHWVINETSFVYNYLNYEYDEEHDRYYVLEESRDLRECMDGALVKRRISKETYLRIRKYAETDTKRAEEETERTPEEIKEVIETLINKGVKRMEKMINEVRNSSQYWDARREYDSFVKRFAESAAATTDAVERAIMQAYEEKHSKEG